MLVEAHDVVGVVEVRDVVEGHGRREVFGIGKSGLFWLLFTALKALKGGRSDCLLLALIKPVKSIFDVQKKEESQFAKH